MKLKDLVKLSKKEKNLFKGSFDLIGDVAVLEIDERLKAKKKQIAEAIVKIYPFVKTVLNKKTERMGKLRLRKFETLYGRKTETIHKESGCVFKLDVKKVYFSPREGTERLRIASQVKPKENVVVFFGGVAPYGIIIAKKQPKVKEVYSIELNEDAHKYAMKNVKLNRLEHIVYPVCANVKTVVRKFYGKCERVVMPLPKEGYKYLPEAFKCLKPKGYIHFYYISEKPEEGAEILKKKAEKQGRKIRILRNREVLPYKPRIYKWCIDAKVY